MIGWIIFVGLMVMQCVELIDKEEARRKRGLRTGRRAGHIQKLQSEVEAPVKSKTGEQRRFIF